MRPVLQNSVSICVAEWCTKVGNALLIPMGEQPPCTKARQQQQFTPGQPGYGFFACHSGRLLSVERRGDRRQKHITPAGLPGRNQRLEHTRRVLTESESHICAGDGAGIEMAVRYV